MQQSPAFVSRNPGVPLDPCGPRLPGWLKVALVANDRIRSFSWGSCHLPRGPTPRA